MNITQQMEQYSIAYLRAVAATAGFTLYKPEVDDDSLDWGLAATGGEDALSARPRVELQLKCCARDIIRNGHLAYPLSVKNYNDLRIQSVLVPRILVVVLAPPAPADWLVQTEEELRMRHCGYWLSLRGSAAVENEHTVTVHLPRAQVLSPDTVGEMMGRINAGQLP